MKNYYLNTPIFKSNLLKKQYGLNVSYKMECFQPSGSFKIRGMDTFLKQLAYQGVTRVVASSGGNAGFSLAYIGKQMGISVKLIVPKTTCKYMIDKIELLDVDIEIHGENWNEANDYAIQISKELDLPYVPPFDHQLLWKGISSIIDECALSIEEPDRIIVSVGGGSLLCGVFEGLIRNNWGETKIVTAETEGAASFTKSYQAGKLITLDEINTIARSLGAKKVAAKALEYALKYKVETYVTDDKNAFNACRSFFNEYHTLVEPACGAALSYVINKHKEIDSKENVLVIVCGGVNMGIEKFLEYSETYNN